MEEEIIQTEFNGNTATLARIDNALRNAGNAYINNQYSLWFKFLEIAKREVIVKLYAETQKTDLEELSKKVKNNLNAYMISENKSETARFTLEENLDEYETMIRERLDERGMLLKDGDGDSGL